MKKRNIALIITIIGVIIIPFSFSLGILICRMGSSEPVSQEESTSNSDTEEAWKEYYDDKIGLYFRYPNDCTNVSLESETYNQPTTYTAYAECTNGQKLSLFVNPLDETPINGELVEEKLLSISNQAIRIFTTKENENSYLSKIDSQTPLVNMFNDRVFIEYDTDTLDDWEVYTQIIDSVEVNSFYRNWKTYHNAEQDFFFLYPEEYAVDDEDGRIRVSSPLSEDQWIYVDTNKLYASSRKVHRDNIEIYDTELGNRNIKRIHVYCTNHLFPNDVYCSSEYPVSNIDPDSDKTIEAIYYSYHVREEGEYYYVEDFDGSRKNFMIMIEKPTKVYSKSSRYYDLIVNSIIFTKQEDI